MKTVKRGNIDFKQLTQHTKEVETKKDENPEAQNLLTRENWNNWFFYIIFEPLFLVFFLFNI